MYCELVPGTIPAEEIRSRSPRGLIFSGGRRRSTSPEHPTRIPPSTSSASRYWASATACNFSPTTWAVTWPRPAAGSTAPPSWVDDPAGLFEEVPAETGVWMSHGDVITGLPDGFRPIAHSLNSPCAAFAGPEGRFGIQFHPEVAHTPAGKQMLRNFLTRVCGCAQTWEPRHSSRWRSPESRRESGPDG